MNAKHIVNSVLSSVPNRKIFMTLSTHVSTQNHPVSSHLAHTSYNSDTDRSGSLHLGNLTKPELIFTESSSLNGSRSELAREESEQDLEGRTKVATTLWRSFQSNMEKDKYR